MARAFPFGLVETGGAFIQGNGFVSHQSNLKLGRPVVPTLSPLFWGEGSPKIDDRKKKRYQLILTSPLEE